jgi:hypothetical protein
VLPLLRDELRVVLAPGQLSLVHLGWTLTRRGLVPRIKAKHLADCVSSTSDGAAWDAAIRTLDAELPRLLPRRTVAKVILSNHFTRYVMVPWSEALSNATEEMAYARHCFRQLYGANAEHWEVRLNSLHAGLPQLASAVDTGLLAALRDIFKHNGVMLESVQPQLMAAYNNSRDTLHKRSAWFVMHEHGSLCLALLQQGRFIRVRTLRSGSDWRSTLSLALQREDYLTETHNAVEDIFLWAPALEKSETEEVLLAQGTHWKVRILQPVLPPSLIPLYEDRFAMALSC